MTTKNKPYEYIVYTDKPAYPRTGCHVRTMRIPRGKTFNDMRDYLPPTVGKLAVVRAYSTTSARAYAAESRSVRCR